MLRPESATTLLPGGDAVQDLHYAYDAVGNLTSMQSLLPEPGPGSKLPGGGGWSFTYDGVYRLKHAAGSNALAPNKVTRFEQTFAYSPSHNLLHKRRDHFIDTFGGSTVTPPHTNIDYPYEFTERPHAPTRVGDTVLRYDPSGNIIEQQKLGTGAVSVLQWDDDGRMVQHQHMGAFQRNYYDFSGRRVLKKSQLGETLYVSNRFEVRNGEMATKHVFAGGTRVASARSHFKPATEGAVTAGTPPGHGGTPPGQGGTPPGQEEDPDPEPDPRGNPALLDEPGTPFYFHADHLGSTSVLTTADGELHEHLRYFPDGEVWIEKGPQKPINGYQFSGKPYDPETGFADFGSRFYDPGMSLWLSVDPALVDEPGGAVGKPMVLSPYAYAAQSPMVFVDPDGREPLEEHTLLTPGAEAADAFVAAVYLKMGWETNLRYNPMIPDPVGTYETWGSVLSGEFFEGLTVDSFNPIHHMVEGGRTALRGVEAQDVDMTVAGAMEAQDGAIGLVGLFAAGAGNPAGAGPSTTMDELGGAARRASQSVGPGKGAVHGTKVHTAFEREVKALGRSNLSTEVSYKNGKVVKRGTKGSVRLDVVEGPLNQPTAAFDLKTGKAKLTPKRVQQIRQHLPAGSKDISVMEVRP